MPCLCVNVGNTIQTSLLAKPMKRIFLSVNLLLLSLFSLSASPQNLFEQLCEVNPYWLQQPDVPQVLYQLPPLKDEKEAIRTHLAYVEEVLRNRAERSLARNRNLDALHRYWQSGNFPINDVLPYRNPIFIDKYNNFCAVGYLVKESGFESVSRSIQQKQNFAYLREIQNEELNRWAQNCGLSMAELAWIQPAYPPVGDAKPMLDGRNGNIYDFYLDSNENPTAVGNFSTGVATYLAGFAGYLWNDECTALSGNIYAIEAIGNDFVLGGDFTQINGMQVNNIALLNRNNGQIQALGTLSGTVRDLKVWNGNLYAGGTFGLAKWENNQWTLLASCNGEVRALCVWKGELVVGGNFTELGGQNIANIAVLNTNGLSALDGGLTVQVYALIVFDGKLYTGTALQSNAQSNPIWYHNGMNWDKHELYMPGKGIYALATNGKALYLGGDFSYYPMVGNFGKNLLEMYQTQWGEVFNGYAMFDTSVHALAMNPNSQLLYAGGAFNQNMSTNNLNHACYFVSQTTSIPQAQAQSPVSLFPNPTQHSLNVLSPQGISPQILDLSGRAYTLPQTRLSDSHFSVDVGSLTKGIYVCMVGDKVVKFVRE